MSWPVRLRVSLRLFARVLAGRVPDLEAEIRQARRDIGRDCRVCGRCKPFSGPCGSCPPEWQRRAS